MKKSTILKIVSITAFIAIIIAMVFVYKFALGKTSDGNKNVTISVVYENGETDEFKVKTEKPYLQGAMDDAKIKYETDNGMVMTINGTRADYTLDGAYWCFYVNGEMCNFGIADQSVNDDDSFEIVYTKA